MNLLYFDNKIIKLIKYIVRKKTLRSSVIADTINLIELNYTKPRVFLILVFYY